MAYSWDNRVDFIVRYMYGKCYYILLLVMFARVLVYSCDFPFIRQQQQQLACTPGPRVSCANIYLMCLARFHRINKMMCRKDNGAERKGVSRPLASEQTDIGMEKHTYEE